MFTTVTVSAARVSQPQTTAVTQIRRGLAPSALASSLIYSRQLTRPHIAHRSLRYRGGSTKV